MKWFDPISCLVLIVLGFAFFLNGFDELRRRRIVEDIPTSTIRGLALGPVEVIGKARTRTELISPIMQKTCVFYKYLIERYRKRGNLRDWVMIAYGDSSAVPFIVEDSTGSIMVCPEGADYIMPEDFKYETSSSDSLPGNLKRFSSNYMQSYIGLLSKQHKLRFSEWIIQEGDSVYALGTAQKSTYICREMNKMTKILFNKLKNDPVRLKRIDLNKDGQISQEECRWAEEHIKKSLLEKMGTSAETGDVQDVVVAKGEKDEPFIISDQSQKYVRINLTAQSPLQIIFGGLAAVTGIGLLINMIV